MLRCFGGRVGIRVRGLVIGATTFAFGHRTLDVRLVAPRMGTPTLRLVFDALKSFAFTLGSRALAFVCAHFSAVCRLLAVVCDSVPLISDSISLGRDPLAPCELSLTVREGLLALIELRLTLIKLLCAAIELTSLVGAVLSFHDFRLRWWAPEA